ncbi:MAG: hypothetical protein ACQEUZ_00475 [Pseudomonadota bacterium]
MSYGVPLHQHWHDIWRRRWAVLLTAASAAGFAWLLSGSFAPVYEAKATFYLADTGGQPSFTGPAARDSLAPEPLVPFPEEKAASVHVGVLRGLDAMTALREAIDGARPLPDLRRRVDVTVSSEFMINVFARDRDPEMAARIANAAPDIYRRFHETSMRRRATAMREAMAGLLEDLEARLAEVRTEQRRTRLESGLGGDEAALDAFADARRDVQESLAGKRVALAETRARLAALSQALAEERELYREGESVLVSPALERLEAQADALHFELAALDEGPRDPRRQELEGRLESVAAELKAARERLTQAVTKPASSVHEALRSEMMRAEADRAAEAAGLEELGRRLQESDRALQRAIDTAARLGALEGEAAGLAAEIEETRASLREAALQSEHASAPLVLVQSAVAPDRPAFPLPVANAVVAGFAGLLAGVYYALILAYVERLRLRRIAERLPAPRFAEAELARLRAATAAGGGA